jgi:hypothetical protein
LRESLRNRLISSVNSAMAAVNRKTSLAVRHSSGIPRLIT